MAQFIWDSELSLQQHRGSELKSHVHGQNCMCTNLKDLSVNIMDRITPRPPAEGEGILTGNSSKW